MKTFYLCFIFFNFISLASAKTTLEFDLTATTYNKEGSVPVDIKKLNAKLKKNGLDGLPERIIISSNPAAYFNVLEKRIKAVSTISKTSIDFPISNGYLYEYPEICYRGEGSDVGKMIQSMVGNFLNSDQALLGVKFKSETVMWDSDYFAMDGVEADEIPEEIETWKNYNPKSSNVLVMSNLGQNGDGTELYSTFIGPCK